MKASDAPTQFPKPFGAGAGASYIRPIPEASQIGIENGAASLEDGFPPLNFTDVRAGGVPPFGQDMNGIHYEETLAIQYQQAGFLYTYDSTFSTAIGGYPAGAIVASSLTVGLYWVSTADDNTTDPDTSGRADWAPLSRSPTAVSGGGTLAAAPNADRTVELNTVAPAEAYTLPATVDIWAGYKTRLTCNPGTPGYYAVISRNGVQTILWPSGGGSVTSFRLNDYETADLEFDGASWRFTGLALQGLAPAQGRLTYVDTTHVKYAPYNGNRIMIDGVVELIPSAGVTATTSGLAVSTLYYGYLAMSAGAMVLELSTTGHSTDSATGIEVKTGDATRTFVGLVRTNASTQFADNVLQRFVRSWYNRPPSSVATTVITSASTTSATPVELDATKRAEFVCFADDTMIGVCGGTAEPDANRRGQLYVGLDGTAVGSSWGGGTTASGSAIGAGGASANVTSEGYHYTSAFGAVNVGGSTSTFVGAAITGGIS